MTQVVAVTALQFAEKPGVAGNPVLGVAPVRPQVRTVKAGTLLDLDQDMIDSLGDAVVPPTDLRAKRFGYGGQPSGVRYSAVRAAPSTTGIPRGEPASEPGAEPVITALDRFPPPAEGAGDGSQGEASGGSRVEASGGPGDNVVGSSDPIDNLRSHQAASDFLASRDGDQPEGWEEMKLADKKAYLHEQFDGADAI